MKICVMGYSGSGKSTLAAKLAEHYGTEVLHLDRVHWLPGWKIRNQESKEEIVRQFLDTHENWVIDGEYGKLYYEERLADADQIILLLLNRWNTLYRVIKRYIRYHGSTRPDMGEGCNEKLDWAFIKWVLHDGRTKKKNQRHRDILQNYPTKVIVLKSQKQIDAFERKMELREGAEKNNM